MAVLENGKVSEPSQDRLKTERSKKNKPRRGYVWWCLSLIARLCIWYVVLTPFFRCPSNLSELEESSPRVCKPYLIARSHLGPHIAPYYQSYAAPYVELARPYAQTFSERIYTPASKVVKHGYDTYGAPVLEQAGKYSHRQWEAVVVPQLYSAQAKVNDIYKASLDPYVQQAIVAVSPYSDAVSNKVVEIKDKYILPLYVQTKPFIGKTYSSGRDVISGTVAPLAQKTWSSLIVFVKGTVWPRITGLYSENVEPQLVKIGQKLATYREGKKLRAVMDEVESSIEESATPTPTTSLEDVLISQTTSSSSTRDAAATKASLTSEQKMAKAREQIASDLRTWQEKFAAAADKGVEDLGDRIQEIVASQLESGAKKHGKSLVEALETVVDHEFSNLKAQINTIVGSLPAVDAPQEEENAIGDLQKAIRSAGLTIRDRAHALREWHNAFQEELVRRVSAASESTLDVLDGIRDLGLQEIGMRWAWMDGVTYKDWAKYHAVRKQFDDWRNEVRDFGLNHEKVEEAKAVASDILSRGMAIAEDAAKELTRLREVGKWKIEARDVSDNFDTRTEPPVKPAAKAVDEDTSQSDEELQSAILRDGQPSETADADVSSSILETETQDLRSNENETLQTEAPSEELSADEEALTDQDPIVAESFPTSWSETETTSSTVAETSTSAEPASSKVWGGAAAQVLTEQQPILDVVNDDEERKFSEQIELLTSEAGERYAKATKVVSEALFGPPSQATKTTTGPLESISSIASSRLQEALSIASEQYASLKASIAPTSTFAQDPILLDAQRRYYEAVGLAHDHYTAFVESASQAIFGTPTPTPSSAHFQDLLNKAEAQYSQASSLASASLAAVVASLTSAMGSTTEGTARSIVEDASSRYSAALSAASASLSLASASVSSALYGTPTGTLEAMASKASENWESLISRASEQVYGTSTPYMQQLYNQQLDRYEALESLVSELVVGKEPEFTESVMSKLRSAYETPYPAAALSSASSYASDAYESASSFVATHATPLPVLEDILNAANEQFNSAVDAASSYVHGSSQGTYEHVTSAAADAFASASSQVSEAVYGTQPGYVEAARSQVDEAFSSAQSALSTAIYGTPTTGPAESAFSAASGAYASATSAVADNVSAALESATSRLSVAVDSAQSRLSDLASKASDYASKVESSAASVAEEYQSSVSSATSKIKDEL
ncbi:hypothetical protein VTN77DRAFT_6160 [Rasamsonia byssochlamydoides]|uniref:uncharacterized protein n=1 Tax=Rasamsonia byssochlamydoides TaxID=89139 RepID=UPI003743490E